MLQLQLNQRPPQQRCHLNRPPPLDNPLRQPLHLDQRHQLLLWQVHQELQLSQRQWRNLVFTLTNILLFSSLSCLDLAKSLWALAKNVHFEYVAKMFF